MDSRVESMVLFFVAVLLWAPLVSSRLPIEDAAVNNDQDMIERYHQWRIKYGRNNDDAKEAARRFPIFKKNVEYVDFVNGQNRSYKLTANQFADQNEEEFRRTRCGFRPSKQGSKAFRRPAVSSTMDGSDDNVPASIDWRKKGAVTPIQDQADCGSCWAFSAVAAIEGIIMIKEGTLVDLSEQQLVDCDVNDRGCGGGEMTTAFDFVLQHRGLASETAYPYAGVDEKCNKRVRANGNSSIIAGHEHVPASDEMALLRAVAKQPVSVGIEASSLDFRFYSSGIFAGECGTELDHGVAAVGYGIDDDGTKFWIVKNSWGTEWGEDGYIRMKRDVDQKGGICGIAIDASYPSA
ncbi:Senescence-specific cysteine protease [Nymphaea thermarum]|nr:Senescence-specific cysteine protease [Nymphaea thermarum]